MPIRGIWESYHQKRKWEDDIPWFLGIICECKIAQMADNLSKVIAELPVTCDNVSKVCNEFTAYKLRNLVAEMWERWMIKICYVEALIISIASQISSKLDFALLFKNLANFDAL